MEILTLELIVSVVALAWISNTLPRPPAKV